MTPLLMEEGGLQQERFIRVELLFGEVRSHRLADAEQDLIRAVGIPVLADGIHGSEDVLSVFLNLPLFLVCKGLRRGGLLIHMVSFPAVQGSALALSASTALASAGAD